MLWEFESLASAKHSQFGLLQKKRDVFVYVFKHIRNSTTGFTLHILIGLMKLGD